MVEDPFLRTAHMTGSTANLLAIIVGVGIFLVVVAIGWRSVQNRRILRVQGTDGQETVIVASEDDDISSVVSTAAQPEPAPDLDSRPGTTKI
jgi:hypothetical protein